MADHIAAQVNAVALWAAYILRLSQRLLFRWLLRHSEGVVRTAGFLSALPATVWRRSSGHIVPPMAERQDPTKRTCETASPRLSLCFDCAQHDIYVAHEDVHHARTLQIPVLSGARHLRNMSQEAVRQGHLTAHKRDCRVATTRVSSVARNDETRSFFGQRPTFATVVVDCAACMY